MFSTYSAIFEFFCFFKFFFFFTFPFNSLPSSVKKNDFYENELFIYFKFNYQKGISWCRRKCNFSIFFLLWIRFSQLIRWLYFSFFVAANSKLSRCSQPSFFEAMTKWKERALRCISNSYYIVCSNNTLSWN